MTSRATAVAAALAGLHLAGFAGPGQIACAQQIRMLTTEERIALTHKTRLERLRRIVRELGITPEPVFYEYVVPAEKMPSDFPHAVPVLRIVFPDTTFFDTAQTEILPRSRRIISAMATMLEGDVGDVAVFIAGHTDNRGGEAYNQDLSVRRARSVAEALRDSGANKPRLWSIGFGESLPLVENAGEYNLSLNRRVEFLLAERVEPVAYWMKEQMALICKEGTVDSRGRCIRSVKLRDTYVADPVPPRVRRIATPRTAPHIRTDPPPPPQVSVQQAEPRIVVSLKERRYVVSSIEH